MANRPQPYALWPLPFTLPLMNARSALKHLLPCVLLPALAACQSLPDLAMRTDTAQQLAKAKGWQAITLPSTTFTLQGFGPPPARTYQTLSIYIEGDGLAWLSATQPSFDPTPLNPLALQLALAQPQGQAAYLARPCQYQARPDPLCQMPYWTHARFANSTVEATDQAISQLKTRYGATRLILVGYSGGGAIATLVASRRHDIAALVTVAGNLETQQWVAHHRISPLEGSLNPGDVAAALHATPQWHLVGQQDEVVPAQIARAFTQRAPARQQSIMVMPGVDHTCCWAEQWPALWRSLARHTVLGQP